MIIRALVASFLLGVSSLSATSQTLPAAPPDAVIKEAASSFHEYDTGNTFSTIVNSGDKVPHDVVMPIHHDPSTHGSIFEGPGRYPSAHIEGLTRRADFVGVAVPLKRWSYPTDGNHFAFSIYASRVTSVINPGKQQIAVGQLIYIVRAGGAIEFEGHTIHAIDEDFKLFHLNEEYIFFARSIGESSFKVDSESSLLVHEGQVVETSVRAKHPDFFRGKNKDSVLRESLAARQMIEADHKRGGE